MASASASNSNSANQSSCGFKYAEAHEIATATLKHGCLQPTVGNFSDFIFASQRYNGVADVLMPALIEYARILLQLLFENWLKVEYNPLLK